MNSYIPRKVSNYLHSFYVKNRTPTYVQTNLQGELISWYGRPQYYGLSNLTVGQSAMEQLPFLEGLLPIEQPEILEFVRLGKGRSAHIHLIPVEDSIWLLFVDASTEHDQRQKVQQQTYEVSLLGYRYSQLVQELEITQHAFSKKGYQFEQVRTLRNQLVSNLSKILHTSSLPETSYLELLTRLQKMEIDDENALNSIENEIHHLLILVGKILQQDQIEIEKLILQPTICNIRELVADLESLFASVVEERGILFSTTIDENIPKHLLLDELRFRQVLINLLNNAFKFTPKGFIELSLSWQKDQLKFVVNDSGTGIVQEKQPDLFKPHYRDKEISTHSGVGLIVSHHLVELMKGKLRVKSLPQLGATFEGVIEAVTVEFSFHNHSTSSLVEIPPKKIVKILVVDESVDTRNLLRIYLEDHHYEVVSASNSSEAVFVAWHTRPELIIIAMQLTAKDGYSVVKELRGQQFTKPIIALLDLKQDDKDKAMQVGCTLCLNKPIWKETLLETVKQVFESI